MNAADELNASPRRAAEYAEKGQLDKAIREYEELLGEEGGATERIVEKTAELFEARAAKSADSGKEEAAAGDLGRAVELWSEVGRLRRAVRAARARARLDDSTAGELTALRKRRVLLTARDIGLAVATPTLLYPAGPPGTLWPLALVGFIPLLYVLRRGTPGRAFLLGWLVGFLFTFVGNYWGAELLERFTSMGAFYSVGAVVTVALYQGVVIGLWAAGIRWLSRGFGLSPLITAPLLLVVCEAMVPFVFDWYVAIFLWRAWPLIQVAELGGPLAVSALMISINLVLLQAGAAALRRERPPRSVLVVAAVLAAVIGLGLARAAHVASLRSDAPTLRVGLVQPNFGIVSMEARKMYGQDYVKIMRKATEEAGRRGAELVVWPESMFPFLFDRQLEQEYAKGHPWELRGTYKGRLLAGMLTHLFGESYVYNSGVLFAANGERRGIYDKNVLLVWGEYIPFADRFPDWAESMREELPDWPEIEPGSEAMVLVDDDLRIAPFICYEDILPGYAHEIARRGNPNLLVTLANHAWFGDSLAPPQSMAMAMFRGVELRRDLVRSTNTGVTSFSDSLGRLIQKGPLYDVPRDKPLPPEVFVDDVKIMEGFALGPYTGPLFPWAAGLALLVIMIVSWRKRRASEQ